MVFLNIPLLTRCRGPDEFWRKRKIFKLAAHYIGRRRNCYSITIRNVQRALMFSTIGRRLKKLDMKELFEGRVDSAAKEHGINFCTMHEGLTRSNILLNRKSLMNLAIWEPRTFKSLSDIACARMKLENFRNVVNTPMPENVILKGLIKK